MPVTSCSGSPFLNFKEAELLSRLSRRSLYRHADQIMLVKAGRRTLVRRDSLMEWLNNRPRLVART